MAQRKAFISILQNKLSLVTSHNGKLHDLFGKLDDYVNNLTDAAKATIDADDQELASITEMSSKVETVLAFLMTLHSEIEEITTGASASPSDFGVSQSTSSLSLSEFSSVMNPQRTQGLAPTDISKLHHRIDVLEMAMAGCRSEVSQSTAQQTEKTKELETRLESLETSDVMTQSDSIVKNLEKRLKKLETGGKRETSRLDKLVEEIEILKSDDSNVQQSSRTDSLEKQVKTLTKNCDSMQNKLVDVQHCRENIGELTSRVDGLADKGDLLDVMKTTRSMTKTIDELTTRVDANESSVKTALSYREKEENKRRELEDKILMVEAQRRKDQGHYTEKWKELDSLYKQVCQLVDSKVTPLRRLLNILNDLRMNVGKREELSDRLNKLVERVEDISPNLLTLGKPRGDKQQQIPVGFTAYFPWTIVVTGSSVIKHFSDVRYNGGSHYDPTTCEFTAPQDGLYVTSVTLRQFESDGRVEVRVNHIQGGARKNLVCKTKVTLAETSSCAFGIVSMKTGDKLFAQTCFVEGTVKLSSFSSFSCVLIS